MPVATFNPTGTGRFGNIQTWTAPYDGTIQIEVFGAEGGGTSTNNTFGGGGRGARMRGDFTVVKGDVLQILVGQAGGCTTAAHGGGGGTFVYNQTRSTLLIVAGGGGGIRSGTTKNFAILDATTSTTGVSGTDGAGGTGGGAGLVTGSNSTAGAGFSGDAAPSNDSRAMYQKSGAMSFLSGGVGGVLQYSTTDAVVLGGFGGGGAGGWGGAAGGGGYSGGGGGGNSASISFGGGGGSYNAGTNQSNSGGVRTGSGLATITFDTAPNAPTGVTATPATVQVGDPVTISWTFSDSDPGGGGQPNTQVQYQLRWRKTS